MRTVFVRIPNSTTDRASFALKHLEGIEIVSTTQVKIHLTGNKNIHVVTAADKSDEFEQHLYEKIREATLLSNRHSTENMVAFVDCDTTDVTSLGVFNGVLSAD